MAKPVKKKQIRKNVEKAKVFIKSSFNNTLLSATDLDGNVIAWASAGKAGFKGSKKSTPYAATQAAKILIDKMHESQVSEISIFVSGISSGRDAAVRAFAGSGFRLNNIKDTTPLPHNGCRPKKPRRI